MDNRQIQPIADILYAESNAKAVTFLKQLQTEEELFVLLDDLKCQKQCLAIPSVVFQSLY